MELESQVAKIQLGPEKAASSFVYINAEKLQFPQAESFIVAEISSITPNLAEASEHIILSAQAALKRGFRYSSEEGAFEAAIAQVNEELGKLASLGQIYWIDKISAILAVKTGGTFNIATTGKVIAYLLRNGELTDISCSAPKTHPLKTFENFASGKLKLDDILILSTNQLFNHLSVDRLKGMLKKNDFLKAASQIVEILRTNTNEDIAFGTMLVLESIPGRAPVQGINLEEYAEKTAPLSVGFWHKILGLIISTIAPNKRILLTPNANSIKIIPNWKNRIGNFGKNARNAAGTTKNIISAVSRRVSNFGKSNLNPSHIKDFTPQKKFLFISILVLVLALIFQTTIAINSRNNNKRAKQNTIAINNIKNALNDSEAALLYKDGSSAKDFYQKAQDEINKIQKPAKSEQDALNHLQKQMENIRSQLEKTTEVKAENLGALTSSNNLIVTPEFLAAQSERQIISYNRQNGIVRDDALKFDGAINLAAFVGKGQMAVYSGEKLWLWNYLNNKVGAPFEASVPKNNNAVGFAYYTANSRVYILDRSKAQILNFAVLENSLGKPLVSANLPFEQVQNAVDIAVDGNIYILSGSGVKKFYAGKEAEFNAHALITPLKNAKKIIAAKEFGQIYILDSGNNRIVILNKKGNLIETLTSKEFANLRDFSVDEKNKTIFVLNGSSLLKVILP